MTEASTAQLAQQQADLAAALVANGSTPEGFDELRIAMASKMLLRKRTHAAIASWPAFARLYGPNLERDFTAFAVSHPMPSQTTPREDVLGFARFLADEGKLAQTALRMLCVAESRYFVPVRRGPFISIRLPLLGVLTLSLPWASRRFRFRADCHTTPRADAGKI